MIKTILALLCVVLTFRELFCQDRPSDTSDSFSFGRILSESHMAMGDEKDLEKVQSITALAACEGLRGKYITEIYSARGDRLLFKQVSTDGELFLGYVNGEHTWTKDEQSGEVSSLDKTFAAMFRGHEFQLIPIILTERFSNPVHEGEQDFAGNRCFRIRMIDELGNPCQIYFNTDSHLLAGLIIADPRGNNGETVRIIFNEWVEVDKIKLPASVKVTDRSGDWFLDFHTIKLNGVDESIFDIPSRIAAMKELGQLLQQERIAHFGKDAKMLVSVFADDFVNISAGKISRPTREESIKRLQAYFDRSDFLEWDNISPPVIRISQDATMAYAVVHKRVRIRTKNEQGVAEEVSMTFAWLETYEKKSGQWLLTTVASTNEPMTR